MECTKRCKQHPEAEPRLELTPHLRHHGRWVCTECNKFIVLAKQPKTSDALTARQACIVGILKTHAANLPLSDINKLCKYYNLVHLTDMQAAVYDRMVAALPLPEFEDEPEPPSVTCLVE